MRTPLKITAFRSFMQKSRVGTQSPGISRIDIRALTNADVSVMKQGVFLSRSGKILMAAEAGTPRGVGTGLGTWVKETSMAGVNFGTAAAEEIRRSATQMKLDAAAAEMAAGSVMRFGERAPGKPTPNMVRDLPFTCPTCLAGKLAGMAYHVFVSGDSDRFMVWAEGVCPSCMSRQVVIWDPLDVASAEAQTKVRDEREGLVREWIAQLEDRDEVAAVA